MRDILLSAIGKIISSSSFIEDKMIKYKQNSLRIVYYHMVSDKKHDYYFDDKGISTNQFIEQIKFFKKKYEIISLKNALEIINQKKSLKHKLVITFDDGFKENYSIIAPILNDLQVPATFFFISNCIDNKDLMWRNKLLVIDRNRNDLFYKTISSLINDYNISPLKNKQSLLNWSLSKWPMKYKEVIVNKLWLETMPYSVEEYLEKNIPYCSSTEIRELHNNGFGIGSHSMSHPIFNQLDFKMFSHEILFSCSILSKIISDGVIFFSYPFGIRASQDFEKKFFNNSVKIKSFLGIKNSLNNFQNNFKYWERDNLEFPINIMKTRFLFFPIIRKLLS